MNPEQLEQDLMDFAHKASLADAKFVEAKEAFELIDDMSKIIFAGIMDKHEGKIAERERIAYLTQEWLDHINLRASLRSAYSKAKMMRDNYVRMWETTRSLMSSKNSERRMI